MNKPELLSPAGNMEALKAAIHNGADAVYLSGKNFGARKYAENFSNDELAEAFSYAHLYNVKVYVTVNTIIYENEIEEFINYINFLYLNGVDAVIMQDLGMISLVRKIMPKLEIHASTQSNNCNDEVLKLYKNLGVTRVVLARELTLNQINNLKTDIEKEVFIHGALCICYSGCCLFSSLNGGRSGNRGACAGPCRLPYTLIKNGKPLKTKGNFLLSTKELNTTTKIKEILDSNIQSLKIEGRMKSPEYVGLITKIYRDLIDEKTVSEETNYNLKKLFNREFTTGHLFNNKNEDLMNIKTPNHLGVPIGTVIEVKKQIKIKLSDELNQNDGIRFKESNKGMMVNKLYNKNGLLVNSANKNDIIYLDNKIGLKTNDTILKTIDYKLNENLKKYSEKKMPIDFIINAFVNKELKVTINDGINSITETGCKVENSITSPITKEKIITQFSKLGSTPFTSNNIIVNMDNNIFISIKELNELRRTLIDKLINIKTTVSTKIEDFNINKEKVPHPNEYKISVFINNEEQLKYLINKVNRIYTDDFNLYQKYKNQNVFYRTNRVPTKLEKFKNENLLLTELGSINLYSKNNNCIGDYFLNVVNSFYCNYLKEKGIKTITLSPELNLKQIEDLSAYASNLEVIVYGTLELMVMNHCIVNMNDDCHSCRENKYHLKNKQNELFPIINKQCKTHIMHHEKINLLDNIEFLKKVGINNFRLELFDETDTEILDILNKIKKVIEN